MARAFTRSITGRISARLDEVERGVMLQLVGQLIEFVEPEPADEAPVDPLALELGLEDLPAWPDADGEAPARPVDPAEARLFPDAYSGDPDASAEFRRFTERSLREGKLANASVVRSTLERSGSKVQLSDGEAQAWLLTLNDLRLALGARLELVEEGDAERLAQLPDDDVRSETLAVYDFLTWLQDSLVRALN